MVVIIYIVKCAIDRQFVENLRLVVILTVAAIPVGLPTVLSVTMAVGAEQLSVKKVIVKRLAAIEELASVSILCSDKTGTLTLNELTFDKPFLATRVTRPSSTTPWVDSPAQPSITTSADYTESDLLTLAFLSSEPGANDPIELAIRRAGKEKVPALNA